MKYMILIFVVSTLTMFSQDKSNCNDRILTQDSIAIIIRWSDSLYQSQLRDLRNPYVGEITCRNDHYSFYNLRIENLDSNVFLSNTCKVVEIFNTPFFFQEVNQCKLFSMPNLKNVRIIFNKPFQISPYFGTKCRVDSLYFRDNTIDTLSDYLFENPNLKYLSWENNNTRYYGRCENIEVNITSLWYRGYFFSDIPTFLLKACKLKELVFTFGMTTDYSKWVQVLKNNNQLTFLAYDNSKQQYIPDEVFDLDLTEFGAFNGCLTNVSPLIKNLKNLKTINFFNNYLTTLPEEIQELKDSLKDMDLRENYFTKEEKEKIRKWLPNTDIWFDD